MRSSRANIRAADALLLPPCVLPNQTAAAAFCTTKDNGGVLGSTKNQNKLRKSSNSTMGRKKKEKDPSAAEGKATEEKDGNEEEEVEPEKRAGRRSSKPVVAKWAIGGKISADDIFSKLRIPS